jgi:hypothetical protein
MTYRIFTYAARPMTKHSVVGVVIESLCIAAKLMSMQIVNVCLQRLPGGFPGHQVGIDVSCNMGVVGRVDLDTITKVAARISQVEMVLRKKTNTL